MKRYLVTYLIVLIVFVGCSDDLAKMELGHEIDFRPITFSNLPGWMEDDLSKALLPLSRSCKTLLKKHRENWFNGKQFAAYMPVYPGCDLIFKDMKLVNKPMLMLHAEFDDYAPTIDCINYVKKLKENENSVELNEWKYAKGLSFIIAFITLSIYILLS